MKLSLLLALAIGLSGCVQHYGHSLSAASSPPATTITASVTSTGVLSLTAPPLDVAPALLAKCPSGHLSGVETEATVRNWLGLAQVYTVRATATCAP